MEPSSQEPAQPAITLPANPGLTCSVNSEGRLLIRFLPDYRANHAAILDQVLEQSIRAGLIQWDVDLKAVQILQSRALGALVGAQARLQLHGGGLRVEVLQASQLEKMFNMIQLSRMLNLVSVPK